MSEKKITVQCCVPTCHKTNHSEPQILFFPFPKKREMQGRWLHAIHRPELISIIPKDKPFHMFICLEHFKKSDIVSVGGRTCLRAGVVPSVFSWKDEEKKTEVPDFPDRRSKGFGLDKDVVTVTCGGLEAELYKEKFYCPGIHRECILYNNQFITPKMFMIMGDKERLKDWKNAVRIQGVKIRKFIENRQLDFYRHQEFCTGRCVARLPINLFKTKTQPPDKWVNTSGDISNVKFREKDLRPECSQQDSGAMLGHDEIKLEYSVDSDDSMAEEKPDVEILNALLKNPIPKTMTHGSTSGFGITDNQVFWRGVIKLGLMDRCFEVILNHVQTLQTDLILQNVRQKDAHELSAIVREMGLSNKLQHLLASCKQDMDNDCEKLDQQVEELKQKVTDFENRKKMLRKRSEEFTEILKLNTPKASTSNSAGSSEDSDLEEPEVHFGPIQTTSAHVQKPIAKRSMSPRSDAEVEEVATKKIKISNNSILKVFVNETTSSSKSTSVANESSRTDDSLPKIVSISSMVSPEKEDADRPMPTLTRSDGQLIDDALTSEASKKIVEVPAVKTSELKKSLIADNIETGDLKKENVRTVLWVKANGTSEYITFSNNSETKPVDDTDTVARKSPDSQSTTAVLIPSQSKATTENCTISPHEDHTKTSQSEIVMDVTEDTDFQSETVINVKADDKDCQSETMSNVKAAGNSQSERVPDEKSVKDSQSERVSDVKSVEDSQSERVSDVSLVDNQSERLSDVKAGGDDQSERLSDVKSVSDSQSDVKAHGDNQSERVLDDNQSERLSDVKAGVDDQSERLSDVKSVSDSQSERLSDVKAGGDSQSERVTCVNTKTESTSKVGKKEDKTKELETCPNSAKNPSLSPVKKSPRSVSPLFSSEVFGDFIGARRSSRRRTAKVKEDL